MHQSADQDCWQQLLPEFAPLPHAFVELLFTHPKRFSFPVALSIEATLFEHIWPNVQLVRGNALTYVFPFVRAGWVAPENRLSMTRLQHAVQLFDAEKRVPKPATISDWQARNVLRTLRFGISEPNSAAALLIMRAVPTVARLVTRQNGGRGTLVLGLGKRTRRRSPATLSVSAAC